eukprot:259755-Pelagomonas_calceolata.AAC.2
MDACTALQTQQAQPNKPQRFQGFKSTCITTSQQKRVRAYETWASPQACIEGFQLLASFANERETYNFMLFPPLTPAHQRY